MDGNWFEQASNWILAERELGGFKRKMAVSRTVVGVESSRRVKVWSRPKAR